MATIPLHDATIGLATHSLQTLLDLLKKAQSHPEASTLPSTRLVPDMLPFTFQVQTVSNFSKKLVERLAGRELEVWEDNEETLEQLIARVEKTLALLATVSPADLEAIHDKTVAIKMGPFDPVPATVSQYVLGYAVPNMMFHLSMAYALLRMKGLEIGKRDLLGPFVAPFFKGPEGAQ